MTAGELRDALARLGASVLPETLELLFKGALSPVPQDSGRATYAPMLTKEHERVRWDRDARTLHNQIRGLAPMPGAETWFKGRTLKLDRAAVLFSEGADAAAERSGIGSGIKPGTVLEITKKGNPRGFSVKTGGDGALLVLRVKPEGRQSMDALSFANGYGLEVGYEFEAGE
jgi:methionyl-tRNA formyltransferase